MFHQFFQFLMRIEIEMCGEAEASAQWGWQHTFACGGTDHGESWKGQRNRRCARAFAHHHIDTEILHRDMQQLFGGARQTATPSTNSTSPTFQGAKNRSKVTGMLNGRSGSHANRNFKLLATIMANSLFCLNAEGQRAEYDPVAYRVCGPHQGTVAVGLSAVAVR